MNNLCCLKWSLSALFLVSLVGCAEQGGTIEIGYFAPAPAADPAARFGVFTTAGPPPPPDWPLVIPFGK